MQGRHGCKCENTCTIGCTVVLTSGGSNLCLGGIGSNTGSELALLFGSSLFARRQICHFIERYVGRVQIFFMLHLLLPTYLIYYPPMFYFVQ